VFLHHGLYFTTTPPQKMNLQASLFNSATMRRITTKKPKRVYGVNDAFPYGVWKGKKLSILIAIDPLLVENWISKNKIQCTSELQNLIAYQKMISL
jgi:hypothetical protein